MNRKVLKAVSALLAVSVVLPFAACGRKKSDYKEKRSGKKITADTPWYDCSSYVVDAPVEGVEGRVVQRVRHVRTDAAGVAPLETDMPDIPMPPGIHPHDRPSEVS